MIMFIVASLSVMVIHCCIWFEQIKAPTRWHCVTPAVQAYFTLRAATDESQKTLNKCETRNKTVFDTRLRHPETINSVPLNSVLRIKQTCVYPILHLEVTYFWITNTAYKTSLKS